MQMSAVSQRQSMLENQPAICHISFSIIRFSAESPTGHSGPEGLLLLGVSWIVSFCSGERICTAVLAAYTDADR